MHYVKNSGVDAKLRDLEFSSATMMLLILHALQCRFVHSKRSPYTQFDSSSVKFLYFHAVHSLNLIISVV